MNGIAGMRLTAPKTLPEELIRRELLDTVLQNPQKVVYIQAGAGYGKTTLLSQIAHTCKSAVWISLDGENDIFAFADLLGGGVSRMFENCSFSSSEFIPFASRDNFVTILANAFLNSLDQLPDSLSILLDDIHTISNPSIKELIAYIIKYLPENMRLFLSSREAPWPELAALRARGDILELTQQELRFTKEEAARFIGFDDEQLFQLAEGRPLALGLFRVLFQNGVSPAAISSHRHHPLYEHLFRECIQRLAPETVDFLKQTACFEELDIPMLDAVLGIKNARLILDSLAARNIFTVKINDLLFRYHALFRAHLLAGVADERKKSLLVQAGAYYFNRQDYQQAARYAIASGDRDLLQRTILVSYREYINSGRCGELGQWFQALAGNELNCEMLVAKGALLSGMGNFREAKHCLDAALPQLKLTNKDLYIEAALHKARLLRSLASFEESDRLLDGLLSATDGLSFDVLYAVVIEKLYNLCWNSQIKQALQLADQMIRECAQAGEPRVRAWFERYLTVIYFFAGNMKNAVYFYEKSLAIPEDEQRYLALHSIDIYAAKAYQYIGNEEQAVSLITAALQKLSHTGRYGELWAAYVLAAEIYGESAFIDRLNGGHKSYAPAIRYFSLAEEYASLYRITGIQKQWAKLARLTNSIYFSEDMDQAVTQEIFANLNQAPDYLATTILGKLFGHYTYLNDLRNAGQCAERSIEIGERSGAMLIPALAYGILALNAMQKNEHQQAVSFTRRCLKLCAENGIHSYFKMKDRYGLILQFAVENDIDPDSARQMMKLVGLAEKKIYIKTFGGFSISTCKSGKKPVKMRSKKERELLAFLLSAGSEGVTKEQIHKAIWFDSESVNIKKLIDVNISYIRADLAALGVSVSVLNREKHYSLSRDQITSDADLFEAACRAFERQNSIEGAQKILSLYKGEYLSDFASLWAAGKRVNYAEMYKKASAFIGNNNKIKKTEETGTACSPVILQSII